MRRSACSGVMTLAGAPSWVRGRGLVNLKTFRRMVRLLSVFKKLPAGEKSDTDFLHRATSSPVPGGRIRTCYLRLRGALAR